MARTLITTLLLVLTLPVPSAPAQEPLTNDSVVKMVKAGLGDDVIAGVVKSQPSKFSLRPEDLIALKTAGVSDRVLAVMMEKGNAPAASPGTVAKAATPATGRVVKLRDGEKIRLILMEDISSATANTGDRVTFSVAEDLKVGDVVVISKGAVGVGTIAEAQKKKMLGRGGKLTLRMEYAKSVDDQNVRIRATAGREGDDKVGKTVAVAVLAGPFALLVKGKDVVAAKGTEYAAYVDEDKDIAAAK